MCIVKRITKYIPISFPSPREKYNGHRLFEKLIELSAFLDFSLRAGYVDFSMAINLCSRKNVIYLFM